MICFFIFVGWLFVVLLLVSVLVFIGCYCGDIKVEVVVMQVQQYFDVVIKVYKGGQFFVDDVVFSVIDIGSYFVYLKDVGKLFKMVLLVFSDDFKVCKQYLEYMVCIVFDYGVVVYYDKNGELKQINLQEIKVCVFEDYYVFVKMGDDQKSKSVVGSDMEDCLCGY